MSLPKPSDDFFFFYNENWRITLKVAFMYEYAAELAKCVVLVFQTAKGTGVSTSRTSYALETGRAQRDTETWQGREVIEKKKKKKQERV